VPRFDGGRDLANYCLHCGSLTRSDWLCEQCGATPASPWPRSERLDSDSRESESQKPDEVRPVTALFADIVGSTALGELLQPEDVKGLVGECVSRMTSAVESYGGLVTSYMGDGIAAFFGLEVAHEDDAARAALAALEILRSVSNCGSEVEKVWGVKDLSVRIGVNSGRVGTGLVGSAHQHHHALGDPVNVAARLQAVATPGTAMVGVTTAAQLAPLFELESMGSFDVKGKTKAVEAWRLVRYVGERAGDVDYRTRFVGRQAEIQMLERLVLELREGRSRIVTVIAEAGLGKTRLITELKKRASNDVWWLGARCFDHSVGVPLGPFVGLLRDWLGLREDAPKVVTRVRLLARASELLSVESRAVDFLCRLLSVDLPRDVEQTLGQLAPEALWERIRASCVEWLSGLAGQAPVVLVLDDFDRADHLTVEVVTELLALTDKIPITIVLVLRPESSSMGWKARVHAHAEYLHRTVELRLPPMDLSDCEEMVALLDPNERLSPELRLSLASQSEGNPLFMEELTGEALHRDRSSGSRSRSLPGVRLPSALEALLLARVDRLPNSARATAQFAAVCGRRFLRRVLAGAVGSGQFERDLPLLLKAALVREEGRTPEQAYAFTHGLLREAVLSTVTPRRLGLMHEAIARSLEELPDFAERLSLLASHYAASPNADKALEYLEKAADQAGSQSFIADAIEKYRAGLDLSTELNRHDSFFRIGEKLAELYARVGRFQEALTIWDDLLVRANTSDEAVGIRVRIARVLFDSGDFDEMSRVCDETDARSAPNLEAELFYLKTRLALRACDYPRARSYLERANELCVAALPVPVQADLASAWGCYYAVTGRHEEAKAWATRGLNLAESLGDIEMVLRARRDLGTIHLVIGDPLAARSHLEEVYETSRNLGHSTRALDVASNLLNAYALLGDARRGVNLGRDLLTWVRNPFWRSALLVNLADLESELGEVVAARVHLKESLEIAGQDDWCRINAVHASLGEAHTLLHDDLTRVEQITSEVLSNVAVWTIRPDLEVMARVVRGEAAFFARRADVANDEAEKAMRLSVNLGLDTRVTALTLMGLVCRKRESRTIEAKLWEALDACRRCSMRLAEARILMTLGFCLESESYLDEARQIFIECESMRGLADIRRLQVVLADCDHSVV
jgi:class 3 adenylate cyclase/tetratricopeptide (TPR) repeat protein